MTDDVSPQSAKSIKDLLLRAVNVPPIAPKGGHSDTNVYSLGSGFPNYLFRISGTPDGFDLSDFLRRLKNSTVLTPVHLCDRNFGQPLLRGDIKHSDISFQIVSKIPGTSLHDIYFMHYEAALFRGVKPGGTGNDAIKAAEREATLYILKLLNKVPKESLVSFMQDVNYLTEHGIQADIQWGNILFNGDAPPEDQLKLIDVNYVGSSPDQPTEPILNNLSDIIKGRLLYNFKSKLHIQSQLMGTTEEGILETLESKLREAAEEAKLPKTREEAATKMPKERAAFCTLSNITTQLGSSITLGQSPDELKEMLCKITPPLQAHI
jgi:hypothetical protein